MRNKVVATDSEIHVIPGFIGLVALSLLKRTIISLILAFTTVFPFVLFFNTAGVSGGTSAYQNFISSLIGFLYNKTVDDVSTHELLGLFFMIVLLLSFFFSVIEYLVKKYLGIKYKVSTVQILIVMSITYAASILYYYVRNGNDGSLSLMLVFYLFNMYSIFSYRIINSAITKMKERVVVLKSIPF